MRAESKKNKPAKPMKLRIWRNRGLYILLIPMLIYFILFNVLPIWGLQIAFRDFKPVLGITGSPWVGLKYIKKFVTSYSFWTLLRNTLVLSVYCNRAEVSPDETYQPLYTGCFLCATFHFHGCFGWYAENLFNAGKRCCKCNLDKAWEKHH